MWCKLRNIILDYNEIFKILLRNTSQYGIFEYSSAMKVIKEEDISIHKRITEWFRKDKVSKTLLSSWLKQYKAMNHLIEAKPFFDGLGLFLKEDCSFSKIQPLLKGFLSPCGIDVKKIDSEAHPSFLKTETLRKIPKRLTEKELEEEQKEKPEDRLQNPEKFFILGWLSLANGACYLQCPSLITLDTPEEKKIYLDNCGSMFNNLTVQGLQFSSQSNYQWNESNLIFKKGQLFISYGTTYFDQKTEKTTCYCDLCKNNGDPKNFPTNLYKIKK